jgi:hypothetical protein
LPLERYGQVHRKEEQVKPADLAKEDLSMGEEKVSPPQLALKELVKTSDSMPVNWQAREEMFLTGNQT